MLTPSTRTILSWGSAISALVIAFSYWDLLPSQLTNLGTSVIFFMLATVLVSESIMEEMERRNTSAKEILRTLSVQNAISLVIAIAGYMIGIVALLNIALPAQISGIAGFLAVLMAVIIIIERYR